jgi:periplasmic protein TonB
MTVPSFTPSTALTPSRLPPMNRNVMIVSSVLLFHGVALWALQSGLVRHTIELVVPAELLSQFIEPPQPKVAPPAPPPLEKPIKQPVSKSPVPTLPPPPQLMAIASTTPAPNAPTGVTTPQPPAPPLAAPVAAAPAPLAPPAAAPTPAKVELPSSDADYLQNPKPAYPAISKRLGEQGKVLVRVFIGTDGKAQKPEVTQSSGFDRLDQIALATVLKWHYVPGKRGGNPEAMWFVVPINFVLE